MNQEIKIAIIAASSAILGSLISQIMAMIISRYDKRHQRQDLLRQKYEEMMKHFSTSLEWAGDLTRCTTRQTVLASFRHSSARKALNLCILYFPGELAEGANTYLLSQIAFYSSVLQVYDENDNNTAGGQAILKSPTYKEASENLIKRRDSFEKLIISNAEKYTMALVP